MRRRSPARAKNAVEERLFERRRDLFTELSVVFLDTTTLASPVAAASAFAAAGTPRTTGPI